MELLFMLALYSYQLVHLDFFCKGLFDLKCKKQETDLFILRILTFDRLLW